MKGIVLAGGLGTRLSPLTKATNKHLLPIYNKPMIFYPLETLAKAGIKDVMVVVSGPHSGDFISILRNGEDFGFNSLQYGYQWKPNGGIADALLIAQNFCHGDNLCVILGDNTTDIDISSEINNFENNSYSNKKYPKAHIFLKEVKDPKRYGVAEINNTNNLNNVKSIKEKPENPKSNLAVTGLYLYENSVFSFIKECEPSARGELEITDVNNLFIKMGTLTYSIINGFWKDAGTFDSLFEANKYWAEK